MSVFWTSYSPAIHCQPHHYFPPGSSFTGVWDCPFCSGRSSRLYLMPATSLCLSFFFPFTKSRLTYVALPWGNGKINQQWLSPPGVWKQHLILLFSSKINIRPFANSYYAFFKHSYYLFWDACIFSVWACYGLGSWHREGAQRLRNPLRHAPGFLCLSMPILFTLWPVPLL